MVLFVPIQQVMSDNTGYGGFRILCLFGQPVYQGNGERNTFDSGLGAGIGSGSPCALALAAPHAATFHAAYSFFMQQPQGRYPAF